MRERGREIEERGEIEERFVKQYVYTLEKPIYRMKVIRKRGREIEERFVEEYLTNKTENIRPSSFKFCLT